MHPCLYLGFYFKKMTCFNRNGKVGLREFNKHSDILMSIIYIFYFDKGETDYG